MLKKNIRQVSQAFPHLYCALVVVEVAQHVVVDVHHLAHRAVLLESHRVQLGIERQGLAGRPGRRAPADLPQPRIFLDLPLAPHAVDEGVVQEKDRVARRRRHIAHDGADGVVAETVGAVVL